MPKQEYKILEFHGGSNNKFDPRDIADNQNAHSRLSIRRPGRLVCEGDGKTLYTDAGTSLNGHEITNISGTSGGFETGYGLHAFSHDYTLNRDIINDGSDVDTDDTNWTCLNTSGGGSDGWNNASPGVFGNSAASSMINTLAVSLEANVEYFLFFDVGTANLTLTIAGAGNATTAGGSEDYVPKTNYAKDLTHKVTFTPAATASHLYFEAHAGGGGGTINNVVCYRAPQEADTDFIILNDKNEIDIYDSSQEYWDAAKFTLGSRTSNVKPEYYNVDGGLRVCDSNFEKADSAGRVASKELFFFTSAPSTSQYPNYWASLSHVNNDFGDGEGWTGSSSLSTFDDDETASLIGDMRVPYLLRYETYKLEFEVGSNPLSLKFGGADDLTQQPDEYYEVEGSTAFVSYSSTSGSNVHTVYITPQDFAGKYFHFVGEAGGGAGTIDNVSMKRIKGILSDEAVIRIDDGSGGNATIPNGSIIQIDQEIMYVTGNEDENAAGTSTEFRVIRGFANTTPADHKDDAVVDFVNTPKYFGHIKKNRFFEAAISDSVNSWFDDIQTPQRPITTKTGKSSSPYVEQSTYESLRVYNIDEASDSNYPTEAEKVTLEFTEGPSSTGIIKVDDDGAGVIKLYTSGSGSNKDLASNISENDEIVIEGLQITTADDGSGTNRVDLSELASTQENPHIVTGTGSDSTGNFIQINYQTSQNRTEDATLAGAERYVANASSWVDLGALANPEFPNNVKIVLAESDMPAVAASAENGDVFYVHITGQTGVPEFNGVKKVYRMANNTDIRFETSSHGSVGDVSGTTQVQQLLGVIRQVGANTISDELRRKWNFAMSFTYDGPSNESQESLLTTGHYHTKLLQADGSSNKVMGHHPETIHEGNLAATTRWTVVGESGTGTSTHGWDITGGNALSENDQHASLFAQLTKDATESFAQQYIKHGRRYKLTFTVGTAPLALRFGGDVAADNHSDADTWFSVGNTSSTPSTSTNATTLYAHDASGGSSTTYTVYFESTQETDYPYLRIWLDHDFSGSGAGTLDDISFQRSGWGTLERFHNLDDRSTLSIGDVLIVPPSTVDGLNSTTEKEERKIFSFDKTNKTSVWARKEYNNTTSVSADDNAELEVIREFNSDTFVDFTQFSGTPLCTIKFLYNHGKPGATWHPRINGFKIYMKDVEDDESSGIWKLFSKVNFDKGTYQIFSASDEEIILEQPGTWENDYKVCTLKEGTGLTMQPFDTYTSENFFSPETYIDAQYKHAELVGRRVYVGNIRQGGISYPDRIIKSPINRFDIFPETNFIDVAVGDGDEITSLQSFGDRLLQFKRNKLYILNISGEAEVLESEHPNAGIANPSQVVKTSNGIAWINAIGLWFFDGENVECLTRHLELDGYVDDTSSITPLIAFDEKSNRVIYTPKKQDGLITQWYIYDFELRAYQSYYIGNLFPTVSTDSGVQYYSNFVNLHRQTLLAYASKTDNTEVNFYKWSNTSSGGGDTTIAGSSLWESKDFDFGSPGVRKKIYKIYVTYRCSGHSGVKMVYETDGDSSLNDSVTEGLAFENSTNYNTAVGKGFLDTSNSDPTAEAVWKVAELKPSASINNVKSIQLAFKAHPVSASASSCNTTTSSTTTVKLASALGDTDYTDYILSIYDGPARYNVRRINSYATGTQVATVDTLTDHGYGNIADDGADSKYILGAIAPDFEVNDITIVYRIKPIK